MSNASDIRAGGAYVEVYAKRATLSTDLKAVEREALQWAQKMTNLGAGLTAGGAGVLAPLLMVTKSFADTGSLLDDISQRTGVSATALSELQYAAELSGAGIADLETGFKKLSNTVDGALRGEKASIDALKQIGVSVSDLRGKNPDQIFMMLADRVAALSNPMQRAAAAQALFGKAGLQLLPLLQTGSTAINELRREAHELGLTMSGEDVAAAAAFGDSLDRAWAACRGFANTIGAALAPSLKAATDLFVALAKPTMQFIRENRGLVVAVAASAAAVVAIGAALVGTGIAITFAGTALAGLASVFALVAAAAAAPITWFVIVGTAAVGFVGYITGAFGALQTWLNNFTADTAAYVQGLANALTNGDLDAAAEIAYLPVEIRFLELIANLKAAWRDFCQFFANSLTSASLEAFRELINFQAELRRSIGLPSMSEEQQAAANAAINGVVEGLKAARAAAAAAEAKGDQDELKKARDRYEALLKKYNESKPPTEPTRDPGDDTDGGTASTSKTGGTGRALVGTFSARAALGIAGPTSLFSKIAESSAQTAKNTGQLVTGLGIGAGLNPPGLTLGTTGRGAFDLAAFDARPAGLGANGGATDERATLAAEETARYTRKIAETAEKGFTFTA